MESIFIILILALLGTVFGSFAGAQVWRLRAHEHAAGDIEPSEITKDEEKKISHLKLVSGAHDRSRCLGCGHQLAWYDLLPIVSWLSLGGRCRYCREPIGPTEFLLEVGLAASFVLSFILWPFVLETPLQSVLFALWLIGLVLAAILFVYDLRWFILPDRINYAYAGVGLLYALVALQTGAVDSVWSIVGAVAALAGLYLGLYAVSRGAWVGFGDVKLGVGLGLFLLDWRLAIVSVFLANLIGTFVILPLLATKRITRKSIVPFGPFLLIGTFIAALFGRQLIELYISILL